MKKFKRLIIVCIALGIGMLLGYLAVLNWHTIRGFFSGDRNGQVVVDPESGQLVLVNELTILASGEDIPAIVADYGGEVVSYVPEIDTYQVRFPVKDLRKLEQIRSALEAQGIAAYYSFVLNP